MFTLKIFNTKDNVVVNEFYHTSFTEILQLTGTPLRYLQEVTPEFQWYAEIYYNDKVVVKIFQDDIIISLDLNLIFSNFSLFYNNVSILIKMLNVLHNNSTDHLQDYLDANEGLELHRINYLVFNNEVMYNYSNNDRIFIEDGNICIRAENSSEFICSQPFSQIATISFNEIISGIHLEAVYKLS